MAQQLGKDTQPDGVDKARTAEVAGNLTQDTFLQSCQEMAALKREQKAVANKIASARKVIKARGVELGLMDAALKMADWDREEVRTNWDTRRRYMEWLGLPIGTQGDILAGLEGEAKLNAEWHARGATDAKAGKTGEIPDECPDDQRDAYTRGFKGKALEKKKEKGPKKDADGKVIAPPHGQGHDPEFDGEEDPAKKKQEVPADSDGVLG